METPDLVPLVAEVLSRCGIAHGPLRDVSTATNLNQHVTDGHRVFVKVGTIPGSGVRSEPRATAWAHSRGLCPVRPLTLESVQTPLGPVAVFEHGSFVTVGSLLDRARGVLGVLLRTHASDVASWIPRLDPARAVAVVDERLAGDTSCTARFLREQARRSASAIASADPAHDVVLHGDAHVGNVVGLLDGSCLLVDWESLSVGPAEWDYGQLVRTLLVQQPSHTRACRTAVAQSVLDSAPLLDLGLLDAVMRLRASTWASNLLVRGADQHSTLLDDALDMAALGLSYLDPDHVAAA